MLQRNQGHRVKALEARICTRQTRAPGKIVFLTKKHHSRGYSNPASGANLTNTRLLGQMSSSEKSEGTLSQQFRKVMTQSALSFSAQDHQGLISYIFFLTTTLWQPMEKYSITQAREAPRPPPFGLPSCRTRSLHVGKLWVKWRLQTKPSR